MDFHEWLRQKVNWNGRRISRASMITQFVDKGLYPWIQSKGYTWGSTHTTIKNIIASGFYENWDKSHVQSEWYYPIFNTTVYAEDEDHFYFIFDSKSWEHFWANWQWDDTCDFVNFRGKDRQMDIEAFILWHIDFENSKETRKLNEMLDDSVDEDGEPYNLYQSSHRKTMNDIYYQEQTERGGWDGYRR